MHRQRIEQLIAAYGADPARWPEPERALLSAAPPHDPQLAQLLEQARGLDVWLGAMPAPSAPSADLAARILAAAPRAKSAWSWRALLAELGGPRLAAPALAFAFSLGIGLALLLPAAPATDEAGLDAWLSLALLDETLDEEPLP